MSFFSRYSASYLTPTPKTPTRASSLRRKRQSVPPGSGHPWAAQSLANTHSPPPLPPRLFDIPYTGIAGLRKAPRPPKYTHRRKRSRHIRFRDPAHVGLFTVSEADEESLCSQTRSIDNMDTMTVASVERTLSAAPSSNVLPSRSPSPMNLDVEAHYQRTLSTHELERKLDRLSWDSTDTILLRTPSDADSNLCTPISGLIDAFDGRLTDVFFVPDDLCSSPDSSPSLQAADRSKTLHRPPALDFSAIPPFRPEAARHPFALARSANDFTEDDQAGPLSPPLLLSPLPILSPGAYNARRLDRLYADFIDSTGETDILVSVDPLSIETPLFPTPAFDLEDDLMEAELSDGQAEEASIYANFPVPPHRDSHSPSSAWSVEVATPPQHGKKHLWDVTRKAHREPRDLKAKGDHSFLFSLTKEENVTLPKSSRTQLPASLGSPFSPTPSLGRSSTSSSSSRKSLPKRSAIPENWRWAGPPGTI